jgi:hypothetical protein
VRLCGGEIIGALPCEIDIEESRVDMLMGKKLARVVD